MKIYCWCIFLLVTSLAHAEPQSFDLTLTGQTIAGPHPNEDSAVRRLIASFVERLFVRKYELKETPPNGGFNVCLDPNGDDGYWGIYSDLGAIAIRNSVWEINLVDGCEPPRKP